jgi:predicted dehydrogenase/GNAT superfamily N-acetyltransferase
MKILQLNSYLAPEVLAPIEANFGADPLPPTDRKTTTFTAVLDDGTCVATAIVRLDDNDHWHLWYLGVLPEFQRQQVGDRLFAAIESAARESGVVALRTHTYSRWEGMRNLLTKRGWAFVNASMGRHNDGVEEEWLLPLRQKALRIVLVGASPKGRGAELANAIRGSAPIVELVGVCDSDPEVLQNWSSVKTGTNVESLLEEVDADAGVLAVPHSAYQTVRPPFLRRGLALLHEKPLACSLSELLELQDNLTARPTPLIVGVQRRSHPSYVFLKRALQQDPPHSLVVRMSLGRKIESASLDDSSDKDWRNNARLAMGGALIDLGYHAIDLVHFLLDAPLITISCNLWVGDRPASSRDIETAASLVGRAGNTWVKIVVDRGGLKAEEVLAAGDSTWKADRTGVSQDGNPQFTCAGSWDMAVRGQITRFVVACSTPVSPISLWEHLAELRVIEQARSLAFIQGIEDPEVRQ